MIHLQQMVEIFSVANRLAKVQLSQLTIWQNLHNIADCIVGQMERLARCMIKNMHGLPLFTVFMGGW